MKNTELKLLKSLIELPSPSGMERKLAHHIKNELSNYMSKDKIIIDFHNNVAVLIGGKDKKKTVMIDAHLDTLGFLICNIDKDGYISLSPVGDYDLTILRGRKVLVISDKHRPFDAVIGTKHAHLIDDNNPEEQLPKKISDLTLDIGVRTRSQVMKYISIGDSVIIKPEFDNLLEEYYSGSGFDNKAGVFILMETIKQLKRRGERPAVNLIFSFSSQEELGWRGARELVRRYRPSLFVGVDVTCATDIYEVEEREVGRCDLDSGIMLNKGINIHKPSLSLMQSLARVNKIKVQYQATAGDEGFNADIIANENDGIRVLNMGVPCRNLHSPVEIVNFQDLVFGVRLLKSFLSSKKLGKVINK